MCLAIPGRIISIKDSVDPLKMSGRVDFNGIIKEVSLAYVPDAVVGEYVIVHVGFALQKVDEQEAHEVFDYLKRIGELAELETA